MKTTKFTFINKKGETYDVYIPIGYTLKETPSTTNLQKPSVTPTTTPAGSDRIRTDLPEVLENELLKWAFGYGTKSGLFKTEEQALDFVNTVQYMQDPDGRYRMMKGEIKRICATMNCTPELRSIKASAASIAIKANKAMLTGDTTTKKTPIQTSITTVTTSNDLNYYVKTIINKSKHIPASMKNTIIKNLSITTEGIKAGESRRWSEEIKTRTGVYIDPKALGSVFAHITIAMKKGR